MISPFFETALSLIFLACKSTRAKNSKPTKLWIRHRIDGKDDGRKEMKREDISCTWGISFVNYLHPWRRWFTIERSTTLFLVTLSAPWNHKHFSSLFYCFDFKPYEPTEIECKSDIFEFILLILRHLALLGVYVPNLSLERAACS